MSFSKQKACSSTSCMWVALSPFFGGASTQNSDSSGATDRCLMAADKPTTTRDSVCAFSNTDRRFLPTGFSIFCSFGDSVAITCLCSTTILKGSEYPWVIRFCSQTQLESEIGATFALELSFWGGILVSFRLFFLNTLASATDNNPITPWWCLLSWVSLELLNCLLSPSNPCSAGH